jgi:hypothetical protein
LEPESETRDVLTDGHQPDHVIHELSELLDIFPPLS